MNFNLPAWGGILLFVLIVLAVLWFLGIRIDLNIH